MQADFFLDNFDHGQGFQSWSHYWHGYQIMVILLTSRHAGIKHFFMTQMILSFFSHYLLMMFLLLMINGLLSRYSSNMKSKIPASNSLPPSQQFFPPLSLQLLTPPSSSPFLSTWPNSGASKKLCKPDHHDVQNCSRGGGRGNLGTKIVILLIYLIWILAKVLSIHLVLHITSKLKLTYSIYKRFPSIPGAILVPVPNM